MFSATASREPVVRRAQVAAALARRRHRPMLLLDLAVPRDIEPDVATLKDAFLYTVDDLEQAIEDNRAAAAKPRDAAEAIIEMQVERYMEWHAASTRTDRSSACARMATAPARTCWRRRGSNSPRARIRTPCSISSRTR